MYIFLLSCVNDILTVLHINHISAVAMFLSRLLNKVPISHLYAAIDHTYILRIRNFFFVEIDSVLQKKSFAVPILLIFISVSHFTSDLIMNPNWSDFLVFSMWFHIVFVGNIICAKPNQS